MRRQRPRSTRTDTPSPDTTLFRSRHTNGARRLSLKRYAHTPCCSVRKDTTCPSHQFYVAHRKPCNENGPLALPSITFGHKPFGRSSEEHTSELPSLMRISYSVSCLKKKKTLNRHNKDRTETQ